MKKFLFIILSVVFISGLSIYLGIVFNNRNKHVFVTEGYVLKSSNDLSFQAEKYYFNEETSYESKYDDSVLFSDVDGNKVNVPNNTFIHYINGGASVLKKSVILDFKDLNSEIVKYYNLFENTLIEKNNAHYVIDNGGNNIILNDFVIKTSENKYLFVSDNIKVNPTGAEELVVEDYVEVVFVEENITKIENQQVSYQTISQESYIMIADEYIIKPVTKSIYDKEGKRIISLSQMVIDSDDNIEIIDDLKSEDKKDDEDEDKKDDDNKNTNENSSNSTTNNAQNGSVSDVEIENEQSSKNANIPVFTIDYMTVTSNKLDANILINDPDNLLDNTIKVTIYENKTYKMVYQKKDTSGVFDFNVLVENLNPETEYVLSVESKYTYLDNVYEKEFISKVFRTQSLGVALEKYYYSSNSLNYKVKVDDFTKVSNVNVKLFDSKHNLLKTEEVNVKEILKSGKSDFEVNFTNLENNTGYIVELTDILYDNFLIGANYSTVIKAKTLKIKPTFGDLSYQMDKAQAKFVLKVNNVSDVDKGIVTYRYEIYDARTLSEPEIEPVTVYEKNTLSSLDVKVDNSSIYRGVPYVYKLVVSFNDNEKIFEYETGYSSVFMLEGVSFPSVRFDKELVTFERIKGNIRIQDDSNTVSLNADSVITIAYANTSLGTVETVTSSGSLLIPFDVNDLRANETYTLSVFASVDLQDGNGVVNNCFIGSIVVNTEATKPLIATIQDVSGSTEAFSLNARLGFKNGVDNTLEANTLSGITFSLYSGSSTTGSSIKTITKIDRNLKQYESELKELYYDQEFKINPAFFGLNNNDLTSDYYTIKIENAYDYTRYKNIIPIEDAVITVKATGTAPDIPSDESQSMEINIIRNSSAGDKHNPNLDGDTIVGYRIKANYDNSKKYAKKFIYHVHDAVTNEIISKYDVTSNVTADGELEYVEIYLKDGLAFDKAQTDFARGGVYYFSYEALLDLDGNGETETSYPKDISDDGKIYIKTEIVSPAKQAAKVNIYPSKSTSNSFTWKYKISDIDKALYSNNLYYRIEDSVAMSKEIVVDKTDYSEIVLTNLSKGYLTMYLRQALVSKNDSIEDVVVMYQHFEGEYALPSLRYSVALQSNRILVSLLDYETYKADFSRIAGYNLKFESDGEVVTLENLIAENGMIIVDLDNIAKFIHKNISLSIEAYYDSGIEGIDISNEKVALKSVTTATNVGQYYIINENSFLYGYDSAMGSMFNKTVNNKSIYLKNIISGLENTYDVKYDKGVIYNYELITFKKLEKASLLGDGSEIFKFDMIIPGVSLLSQNGNQNIAAGLREAEVLIKLFGANASAIKDDLIYVEVYETDNLGMSSKHFSTINVNIADINNTFKITGLNPKSYYYLEIFANIDTGSGYTKTKLYDVDFKSENKIYYFTTLDNIGISEDSIEFVANSYDDKYLSLTYSVSTTVGYDRIEYEVYKQVVIDGQITRELVNIDVVDDIMFNHIMNKNISVNPGGPIEAGYRYDIVIKPYSVISIEGKNIDVELNNHTVTYDLRTLVEPFVGVSTNVTDNVTEIKVSVFDISKIVVGGLYSIRIVDADGNDITPESYKNEKYSLSTLKRTFVVENLKQNTAYYLITNMTIDKNNDMTTTTEFESKYQLNTPNESGISIGEVHSTANALNMNKVDLVFYNSTKLNEIDEIRYTIYHKSGVAIDNQIEFTPTQYVDDEIYYKFSLAEELETKGLHHIEMQFLNDGVIVATYFIQHTI